MNPHKRILIVDDEEQIILVLRNGLKKLGQGYEIVAARNGQEALERLREAPVDLIITDLKMSGVDGVALTEAAYAVAPKARVIWMTAYDRWESDAQRLGVYRYLLKPVDVSEIRRIVQEALEVRDAPPRRKSILIIDDEPLEALSLSQSLERSAGSDYYVKISLAPDEALSSLQAEHFDLIVTGLHTCQDNLDLVRHIRRVNPKLRTLLLLKSDSPEEVEQARQLAAICLSGPPDLDEFTATVRRVLTE